MAGYRVRSSFLNFDRTFESMEEIETFVKEKFEEEYVKIEDVRNHFIDKNIPFFGVKGIIITKEATHQEANIHRNDKPMDALS